MPSACIFEPDFCFRDGRWVAGATLGVDGTGRVRADLPADTPRVRLPNRVIAPGLVNAHSHAFQRLIRGRTEFVTAGHAQDDFWTWRERMYQAITQLSPEGLYVASRQAFVEMARAGITTVGEFHYVHHQPGGAPYADPNLLAREVIRAARDVGLRITLLRVAYARAGFELPVNPRQQRFYDRTPEDVLHALEQLTAAVSADPCVRVGVAPHSVRAAPRAWLEALRDGTRQDQPFHMHVSEQPAEIAACLAEHGRRPVELLAELGLLSPRFTAVHAIHLNSDEVAALGRSHARVCACPSTEKNLGDGVIPGDLLRRAGVRLCLGTDSQAEIDLFGEARQLDGHLRLVRGKRAVLDDGGQGPEGLGDFLFACATEEGSGSLGWEGGRLEEGAPADFLTLDLQHPSLLGTPPQSLLWSAVPGAVAEVFVAGEQILVDGHHALEASSAQAFGSLVKRVFA